MNKDEVSKNIKALLTSRNLNQKGLAKMVGFSDSMISEMLSGKKNVMPLAEKVADVFDVSLDWLCGNVSEKDTRPRILTYACAGTLSEAIEEYSEPMPVIAQMPRYDFTIMVRGDSMEPEFRSGDEIACLKVNEKAFVQWGKPHVLFTSQGIVVKRLYEGENGFRCVSDNKQYPEFFVPGEDVYSVSLVVGLVRVF
ncbi:XRE family transcriptional regulator [Prevotella communis]|uniref:XRE family transcriptional regulator n=1 Tax=Prevotella communis TaxID=2913614 RepID=UPI001EDB26A1|nr:XRE family transcriptional regulator [Prevotella communis]UKK61068.1 XRE family transcriptional regulator [Prevotella communis]UKK63893.1 XRE family transcriptional regulator [Prevotella communis]